MTVAVVLVGLVIHGVAAERVLYWTDKDAAKIQRVSLEGGSVQDVLTTADGVVAPYGIAIDPFRGRMYWCDSGRIREADLTGANARDLVTDLQFPADLELDLTGPPLTGPRLYWADRDANRIQRLALGGTSVPETVVAYTPLPYYIEVDPFHQMLYWSHSDSPAIEWAALNDPASTGTLISGLSRVRDVAVAHALGKLYWCDRGSAKVQRANLDGSGIEDVFVSPAGNRPHGIEVDLTSGVLFWTDTIAHTVNRGNLDGSATPSAVASGLVGPWCLALYEDPPAPAFEKAIVAGTVQGSDADELSGLAASRRNRGVLWAHNDDDDRNPAWLFAMTAAGKRLGTFTLAGVDLYDGEDIAIGPGPLRGRDYLYLGDIGDNGEVRESISVYRLIEPTIALSQPPVARELGGVETLRFIYPGGPRDAETLLVDPRTGDLYIVTKRRNPTEVYRAAYPQSATSVTVLSLVTTLSVNWHLPPLISHMDATGGDISPQGDMILMRGYWAAYLWTRAPGESVVEAFERLPRPVPYSMTIFPDYQEGIAFDAGGTGYFTVSEGANSKILHYRRVGTHRELTAVDRWRLYEADEEFSRAP